MSTLTASHATPFQPRSAGLAPRAQRPAPDLIGSEAWEREQMLERLRRLRRALPALAQEMAAARRQAASLRTDNRRLSEQVRELRARLDAREHKAA